MNIYELKLEIEKKLGLSGLSDEGKIEVINDLTENILLNVSIALLPLIPEDARAEFDTVRESGDPEASMAFFSKYIPDFKERAGTVVLQTIEEYQQIMGLPVKSPGVDSGLIAA